MVDPISKHTVTPNFTSTTNISTVIPPNHFQLNNVTAKCYSCASKHYFTLKDKNALTNIAPVLNGPRVGLPDGTTVRGTMAGIARLHPSLSSTAQKAHVFPGIKSSSLISLGQLCDDGCTAVLNNKSIGIFKNNSMILQGTRNFVDGLWDIKIPTTDTTPVLRANAIIRQDKTKYELASYLHACAFSPSISTFQKAIRRGHFITWPGIENINFEKILRATIPSAKGHLDQERKNLQSTKSTIDEDLYPSDGGIKHRRGEPICRT